MNAAGAIDEGAVMKRMTIAAVIVSAGAMLTGGSASSRARAAEPRSWDPTAAAAYLDARQDWWMKWPSAARDHDTACVSCHTTLPYALSRSALRTPLNERGRSAVESKLLDQIVRRVRAWKDVAPYYPDQTRGLPKTAESRGTEAILNAVILSRRDAAAGTLSADARLAFANLWALQMRTGDLNGAWAWLKFGLEPWEGAASAYFGATLAAVAAGSAPGGYAASPEIHERLELLRGYLTRRLSQQPLFNRLMLLWASAELPGVLGAHQRDGIVTEALGRQRSDGGWSLATLGPWQRIDGSTMDTNSDGYGTGLASFALQKAGLSATHPAVEKGLDWLARHQDRSTGQWWASSLNKQRLPESDASRFMSDAATAYAVLALASR
jgi:squalene-hopene/tetraprenyl-beta-curcumene cyclase